MRRLGPSHWSARRRRAPGMATMCSTSPCVSVLSVEATTQDFRARPGGVEGRVHPYVLPAGCPYTFGQGRRSASWSGRGRAEPGWLSARQHSKALTGLVPLGAPFRDPTTGCFLSTDPVHGGGDNRCRLRYLVGWPFGAGHCPVRQPQVVYNTARGRRGTTVLRPALFIGAVEGTMKVMAPLDGHALNPRLRSPDGLHLGRGGPDGLTPP